MVFPRNAGFGRCYLVSTRHEILSNVDRNLTGTQLRLRKNRNKINPARESANPIPVLLLSFESQTVVFQLFDFHLRKFKKFIIKKVLLPQSDANIGAKSKIFQLRILCQGQWREQNQAIHRGYLYFKSHTIHIQDT